MDILKDKGTGVYIIVNLNDGKSYIGSASGNRGFSNRINSHISDLRKNKHHSQKLQNAWNKYGEESFGFSVLEYCNAEDAVLREQYYMDIHLSYTDAGYNIQEIAGNMLGFKHSEETKAKISAMQQGELNNRYNTEHSEETRQRMSEAQLGENNHQFRVPRTKEECEKISKTLTGHKRSLETRKKMSEAKSGSRNPNFGKRKKPDADN